jgi:hypothetical protein
MLESKWPSYRPIEHPDFKYELLETFDILLAEPPAGNIVMHVDNVHISLKYELSPLSLRSPARLTVDAGYQWDGPSGPTIDLASWMRGPLVHDALHSLGRSSLLSLRDRKWVDKMMFAILLKDNIHTHKTTSIKETFKKLLHNSYVLLKSTSWYCGVRLFGKSSFTQRNKKKKW